MAFTSNPLSLSVPEPAFESWLRDSGYLELLDHRTTELHRLHSSSSATTTTTSSASALPNSTPTTITATPTTTVTAIIYVLVMSMVSSLATFLSLFTLNPFAKLTTSDFSDSNAAPWTTGGFLGSADCYSFPSSPTQARMRVHENVKRFARNYATLLILFFVCSLYQMPLALLGLLGCLAVWEAFRFCDEKWALDRFPTIRQVLVRIGQCDGGVLCASCWLCSYDVTCIIPQVDPCQATAQRKREMIDPSQDLIHGPWAAAQGGLALEACPRECARRCAASSHTQCHKFCNICCKKCLCVPSGTAGRKEECPCYRDMRSSQGKPKCP